MKALLLLLMALPVVFASAGIRTISAEEAAQQAQAIVLGTVASPPRSPHDLPVPGEACPPYRTQALHLTVTAVVKPHGELAPGPLVVLPAHSAQLVSLEAAACAGEARRIPLWDRVEPAASWEAGDTVAVMLRQIDGRWELSADGSWLVGTEDALRAALASWGIAAQP